MNNKELGKKAAKGVLGAAAVVGVASAAGVDMSGFIRRISILLIGLGLLLGVILGISGEDANLFFALTGIGIFLAAVWFLIATLATWIFTGSTKSKKSTKVSKNGTRSKTNFVIIIEFFLKDFKPYILKLSLLMRRGHMFTRDSKLETIYNYGCI